MILALDIGNTNISICVFNPSSANPYSPSYKFRISSKNYSSDEYKIIIRDFLFRNNVICLSESYKYIDNQFDIVDSAVISSVVPYLTETLAQAVSELCVKPPFIIRNGIKTGFGIKTKNPEQLGADIVSNVKAAFNFTSPPFVVLDMGTATTLTVVNKSSDIIGTIIVPGLKISLEALSESAAQLNDIVLEKKDELIGRDTQSSICSGVINGNIYMIDGFIRNIREQICPKDTDTKLGLVATGGLSHHVIPYTRNKFIFEENLTLIGELLLYINNISI